MPPASPAAAIEFDPARGFGVYIHWPYCTRICPYCDFNVYAAKTRDTAPLLAAIHRDLEGWRQRSGPRRVDTIFLGGGTPSLLSGADAASLLGHIDTLWGVAPGAEITLEANPDDVARFADHHAAGVNRLSLGVQSLHDTQLKFLGRTHSAASAIAALTTAQAIFPSVSLDMIYALPGQTPADWRAELGSALQLNADHLSLYELSIEPGAAFFHSVKRGELTPAGDDAAADLYDLTQELCEQAGYPAYEISNHARTPQHASRHNAIYWRSGDWVGAGPGAHGRLTAGGQRLAIETEEKPAAYLARVAGQGVGWTSAEPLDATAQARERLAMGLRMVEGMRLSDMTGLGFTLDPARLAEFAALGVLTVEGEQLRLTPQGRLTADRITAELAP